MATEATEATEAASAGQRLQARWDAFFFAEESVLPAVLWRVALSVWTIGFFLPRLPYLDELYTELAVHTPHPLLELLVGVPLLPLWAVWLVVLSCLTCLTLFAAGFQPRRMHLLILLHLCYLFGFDISILRGYGELAFYQWLLLWLMPYDRCFDLAGRVIRAPRWGTQLARLQFSLVYAFTVGAKLIGGEGWTDGRTLYLALKGHDYGQFLLSALFPVSKEMAMVMGWMTLLAELFVAIGLWHDKTRRAAMWTCFLLHLGMASMLRVSVLFPLLMWSHLLLFTTPATPTDRAAST